MMKRSTGLVALVLGLSLTVGWGSAGPAALPVEADAFAHAIGVARAATLEQMALVGAAPVPVAGEALPSDAAGALLARHGLAPDATQARQLATWDASPAGPALAGVVQAYLAMADAAAIPGNVPGMVAARITLLDAIAALRVALSGSPLEGQLVAAPALAFDFDGVASRYADNIALLIDEAGDDVYTNNAGGSWIIGAPVTGCGFRLSGAGALLDLDGHDQYVSNLGCGINGGGAGGAGFLLDAAGNDLYRGQNDAVNGGGSRLGTGFLLDLAGDDQFLAGGWGTNGGAYPGSAGMMLDLEGNDYYYASFDGVNGGSRAGSGFLYDGAGSDFYYATGYGAANGGADWGFGMLLDEGGSTDTYWQHFGVSYDTTEVPKGAIGAQIDR